MDWGVDFGGRDMWRFFVSTECLLLITIQMEL
jgi:hypothetical protein